MRLGMGTAMMLAAASVKRLRVQDVFATVLATESGLQAAINALSFVPDLVIAKARGKTGAWVIRDTARGMALQSAFASGDETAFSSYGATADPWVAYCFKKAAKFCDVRARVGVGGAATPAHALAATPGMILTKKRANASTEGADWTAFHASVPSPLGNFLDPASSSPPEASAGIWGGALPNAATYSLGAVARNNRNGSAFVDYLFAHDPAGVVQTFGVQSNGLANVTIATGWASGAQFLLLRRADNTGDWLVYDTARTPSFSAEDARLLTDTQAPETALLDEVSTSAGTLTVYVGSAAANFLGLVIRAP